VVKIKGDDREDLKVLATGVAATLASRKGMWLTDDEFTLGLLEIKPAPAKAGGIPASAAAAPSSTAAVEPSSNAGSGTTGVPTSSETVTTVADSKSVLSEPQAKGTVLSVKAAPVRNTVSTAKTSGSHESKASVAPSRGSVPASRVALEAPSHGGPPAQGAVGNIKLEDGSTKPLKTSNVESEGGRPHVRRANSTSVPQVLTSRFVCTLYGTSCSEFGCSGTRKVIP
jgi:THO complex subunit 2